MEIQEINIILKTNIPKNETVKFGLNLLEMNQSPEGRNQIFSGLKKTTLNNYPFFTSDKKYPSKLSNVDYNEIVEFFFNKDVFSRHLENIPIEVTENKNETVRHNIMTMLRLLFPTGFPKQNNIQNSYDIITNNAGMAMSNITNIFTSPQFSYLKINGKTYTVSKLIWLNDILNHPTFVNVIKIYKMLLKRMKKYNIKDDIFDIELDSNQNQYYNSKYPEYVKLIRILKTEYSNTSNDLLNSYIHSNNIRKFYGILDSIIRYTNDSNTELMNHPELIDVGVNYKKDDKIEIHILADFIGGEIKSDSLKNASCNFTGEILGNEFEKLMKMDDKMNTQKWKLMNEPFFDMNRDTWNKSSQNNIVNVLDKNVTNDENVMNDETAKKIDDKFYKLIHTNTDIDNVIFKLNDIHKYENINDKNLLQFIKTDNSTMYYYINRALDNGYKSDEFIDKIDLSISEYNKRIEINEGKIKKMSIKDTNLNIENIKLQLYVTIMQLLVKHERRKPEKGIRNYGGKNKTVKKNKNKYKTHRKKTIKSIKRNL